MKVLVLTTPTKHHAYFLNKLHPVFDIGGIVYERRRLAPPFPTGPFYDAEQDGYEERFFNTSAGGVPRGLPPGLAGRVIEVDSVNDAAMPARLRAIDPDIAVLFGTGYVKPAVFGVPRWGTINVHRGIAPLYRGLDSDLWAIHERRFDAVGVTIHYVDRRLDTGDILAQEAVPLEPGDEIWHLRYKTTVLAARLVLEVLARFKELGAKLPGRPQPAGGRYFSAMPLETKRKALAAFLEHRAALNHAAP